MRVRGRRAPQMRLSVVSTVVSRIKTRYSSATTPMKPSAVTSALSPSSMTFVKASRIVTMFSGLCPRVISSHGSMVEPRN